MHAHVLTLPIAAGLHAFTRTHDSRVHDRHLLGISAVSHCCVGLISACHHLGSSPRTQPICRQGAGRLVTPKRLVEKENISIYIAKKREIFFVQLSLNIKRTEMARLEDKAAQVGKYGQLALVHAICNPPFVLLFSAVAWPMHSGRVP